MADFSRNIIEYRRVNILSGREESIQRIARQSEELGDYDKFTPCVDKQPQPTEVVLGTAKVFEYEGRMYVALGMEEVGKQFKPGSRAKIVAILINNP